MTKVGALGKERATFLLKKCKKFEHVVSWFLGEMGEQ
jgi:hypothetical protein